MKMFKNIMFVTALFAMSVVNAKQLGDAKTQQRVIPSASQQQELNAQQQEMSRKEDAEKKVREQRMAQEKMMQEQADQNIPSQTSGFVSAQEWDKIEDELSSDKIPSTMRMKQIRNMSLTPAQRKTLRLIEQNILLRKQILAQATTKTKKTKEKQAASAKSWFSRWFDTGTDQTENYKSMILDKLANEELYPTLKSKQEALNLGVEFSEPEYADINFMKKAQEALAIEMPQGPVTPIDQLVNNLRSYFGFNLSDVLSDEFLSDQDKVKEVNRYLNDINSKIKDFVVKYITNTNAKSLLRVINSESQRMQNIIDILNGNAVQKQSMQQSAQKKVVPQEVVADETEEITSPWALGLRSLYGGSQSATTSPTTPVQQAPVTVPQGRPAGNSVEQK